MYECVCVYVSKSTLNIKAKMRYLSFPEFNAKHLLFVLMCRRESYILSDEAFQNSISMKIVLECNVRSSMKRIFSNPKPWRNFYMGK